MPREGRRAAELRQCPTSRGCFPVGRLPRSVVKGNRLARRTRRSYREHGELLSRSRCSRQRSAPLHPTPKERSLGSASRLASHLGRTAGGRARRTARVGNGVRSSRVLVVLRALPPCSLLVARPPVVVLRVLAVRLRVPRVNPVHGRAATNSTPRERASGTTSEPPRCAPT